LIDYYKILKIENRATEAEIKKAFRKLATIYHPDKNNGSAEAEEMFKIILNAYEVLSNKERKIEYDLKYKEEFYSNETQKNYTKTNYNYQYKQATKQAEYKKQSIERPFVNYPLMIFFIIVIFLWLMSRSEKTTTGNVNADNQLEQQKNVNRPESGEIEFKKESN